MMRCPVAGSIQSRGTTASSALADKPPGIRTTNSVGNESEFNREIIKDPLRPQQYNLRVPTVHLTPPSTKEPYSSDRTAIWRHWEPSTAGPGGEGREEGRSPRRRDCAAVRRAKSRALSPEAIPIEAD